MQLTPRKKNALTEKLAPIGAWVLDADCQKLDPTAFDLTIHAPALSRDSEKSREAWYRARALCAGCPVIRECAHSALSDNISGTIRAGLPLATSSGTGALTDAQRVALWFIVCGVNPRKMWRWLMSPSVAKSMGATKPTIDRKAVKVAVEASKRYQGVVTPRRIPTGASPPPSPPLVPRSPRTPTSPLVVPRG